MSIDAATLELLRECVQRKSMVYFSASNVPIVFQTQIHSVRSNAIVIMNSVPPDYISGVVSSPLFFLKLQTIRLVCTKLTTDGVHLLYALDSTQVVEDNRSAKRFHFDSREGAYLEMVNPVDQSTVLTKTLLDMSATGLSFRTPVESKLYAPGQRLEKLRIIMGGRLHSEVSGHVVYQQTFLNQNGKSYCQVGFKFDAP